MARMEREDQIAFFRELLRSNNHIYSWKFHGRERVESNCAWENILENFLFLDTTEEFDAAYLSIEGPFSYINSLSLFWSIIPYRGPEEECIYILGPVFLQDIDERLFKQRMDMENMSVESQIRLTKILHEIPVYGLEQINGYAGMFYYILYGQHYPEQMMNDPYQKMNRGSAEVSNDYSIRSHGSRQYELQMLRDVENGNLDYGQNQAAIQDAHPQSLTVGSMCPWDPLRQAKDMILVQTTLVTRAAIRGGMDADSAYSLSDYYIQQVELSSTEDEAYAIGGRMYDSFVRKVHDIRESAAVSAEVRKCCSLIRQNLLTGVDWDEIAGSLGYSPYYLSARFKAETGMSFRDYIALQKMEQAKVLLAASNLSISELADMLGFSSGSYFSRIFRKLEGCTPREYRNRYKKETFDEI